MKPLEISEEQKERLLEMIKALFPEYIIVHHDHQFDDLNHEEVGMRSSYDDPILIFHWFEFCMLKVFPKLNQWFNAHQLSDFFYQTIGNDKKCEPNVLNKFEHPIDYLYEQFKKL